VVFKKEEDRLSVLSGGGKWARPREPICEGSLTTRKVEKGKIARNLGGFTLKNQKGQGQPGGIMTRQDFKTM